MEGAVDYKVFMSYRRSDSEGITGRIYDRIIQSIPKENVFIDVGEADIVLAVIGTNWLNAREESGKRRIDNPLDPVRLELSKAIEERKLIIPLLIGRAEMPSIRKLPDCLATLSRRNAERVTHENFHMDVERLIQSIDLAFAHYNSSRSSVDQAKPHQARAATNQTDPNKIEQSEFDSIRQRGDAESLRIHISKWPKGVTLVAAVTLLEQLDWEYVANSQDPEMLKWFLAAYPQTSRHEQAQKLIDRYANINHSTSLAVGSGKLELKSEVRSYRSDEGTKSQVSRRTFLLTGLTLTLGTAYLLYRFGGIRAPLAIRPIVTVTSSTKFYSCAFSPDGSQFVTGAYEDVVRIWDANQGAALDSFGKLSGPIRSVNYSRDGQFIGATSGDNSVLVWRTSNHALEKRFTGHTATASSVEFSPDGLTLLTGSEDGTVRLWDLKSGRSLSVMENGKTYVFSAVFSPDGNRIAASLGLRMRCFSPIV